MYRYHHFNPVYAEPHKQNYAYFFSNYSAIDSQVDPKSCIVSVEGYPQRTQIYKVLNMNSFNFHQVAEQLMLFLQKHYGLTLEEIVLDFIKDLNGIEWFIGCKAFKMVDRVDHQNAKVENKLHNGLLFNLVYFSRSNKQVTQQVAQVKREELLERTTTSTCCKLCRIKFRREQLRRVVTDSMLNKLISHLRKRGVFTFEHTILSNSRNTESSSLVCDLCYMLIVAENELLALESKFVKILNIPIHSADEVKPNSTIIDDKQLQSQIDKDQAKLLIQNKFNQKKSTKIDQLPQKPVQWRIIIVLRDLFDLNVGKLLRHSKKDVYLQFRLFEYTTSFKLFNKDNNDDSCSDEVISKVLNQMRVHYFFTLPTDNLREFLDDTEIDIRITDGPDFSKSKPLLMGKLNAFTHFKATMFKGPETQQSPVRKLSIKKFNNFSPRKDLQDDTTTKCEYDDTKIEHFRVFLFSQFMEKCSISLVVGLKKDYETRAENIDLMQFKGVYIPQENFYNCDPLPQTWIELFLTQKEINKYHHQTINEQYMDLNSELGMKMLSESTLPVSQLLEFERKMNVSRERSRLKYSHIESRLYHDTSSFLEKKRQTMSKLGENFTFFNTGMNSIKDGNPPLSDKAHSSRNDRPQTSLTMNALQAQIVTDRLYLNQLKKRDLSTVLKRDTSRNSQDESTDTVNTKLLKRMNSTTGFHQKQVQPLVPYLNAPYRKALAKMLKQYHKNSTDMTTKDTQMSITQDIKRTLDSAVENQKTCGEVLTFKKKKNIKKLFKRAKSQRNLTRLTVRKELL